MRLACMAANALSLDTSSPSSGSPVLYMRGTPLGVAVLAPAGDFGFGLPSRTRPGPSMSPRNFRSGFATPPAFCVLLWPQHTSRSGVPGERVLGQGRAHCRCSRFSSLSSSLSTSRAELNAELSDVFRS